MRSATRRAFLQAGAGALVLAGCRQRPGAAPAAKPARVTAALPVVTIIDSGLSGLADELQKALRQSAAPYSIRFVTGSNTLQSQTTEADLVSGYLWDGFRSQQSAKLFVPLRPMLAKANFDPATILSGALPALRAPDGALIELPWRMGELQFYVNAKASTDLGPGAGEPWTWSRVRRAALAAVGKNSAGTPFLGSGWGMVNTWAAWVVASGGSPYSPRGGVQLTEVTDQTKEIVSFARQTRWEPLGTSGFQFDGFDSNPDALFALFPPWPGLGLPTDARVRDLVPVDFPSGARPAIAATAGDTLAVSATSQHPELAVQFVLWLYRPEQQKLLGTLGVPPVIETDALFAFWEQQRGTHPSYPLFRRAGYVDFRNLLPAVSLDPRSAHSPAQQWDSTFYEAFRRMYQGADVAAELAALQRLVDTAEAQGAAGQDG